MLVYIAHCTEVGMDQPALLSENRDTGTTQHQALLLLMEMDLSSLSPLSRALHICLVVMISLLSSSYVVVNVFNWLFVINFLFLVLLCTVYAT